MVLDAKGLLALMAAGATALLVAGVGSATPAPKIEICHGTASDSNPYVLISVSENALAGHFDGTAPGHGQNNHPDFLAVDGDCTPPADDGGGGE